MCHGSVVTRQIHYRGSTWRAPRLGRARGNCAKPVPSPRQRSKTNNSRPTCLLCIHQHNKLIADLHSACARGALRGLLLALGLWGGLSQAMAEEPRIAFFYGANPPVAELSLFDQVVLEPG